MQFKEGTPVVTADDHRVGEIARVVIDPHTRKVTDVIVRKGFLFTEDRIVPVRLVESATEDEVRLNQAKDTLPELQPLVEEYFVPVDPDADDETEAISGMAAPLYGYPPVGVPWWGVNTTSYWPSQPVAVETQTNLPEDRILLNQGARVISADGQHVGDIDEVVADGIRGEATHFVVAAGLLLRERKIIPTGWIQRVRSDEVQLSVRATVLERLPAYVG